MSRSITCTNNNGVTIVFGDGGFTPFLLAHVDGIYSTENDVSVVQNTTIDGGTFQGTVKKVRNIVLSVMDRPANVFNQSNRDTLYVLFEKGAKGTLVYTEDGESRMTEYYVESVERASKKYPLITISLICPDPYWYDVEMQSIDMANWVESFEFEHEFLSAGEELGERSSVQNWMINNDSAASNIGMTVTITCIGDVTNPSITKAETGEIMKIGSASIPFTLYEGEQIVITTGIGDKHIYHVVNGVRTEINGYLTSESTFIQIGRGQNTIGFAADDGVGNLSVNLQYRLKYEGA